MAIKKLSTASHETQPYVISSNLGLRGSESASLIWLPHLVQGMGAGFVTSMAHPGGNVTGFTSFEYSVSGKWLGLLKELAPGLMRVAVIREPSIAAGISQFAAIQAFASSSARELTAIDPKPKGGTGNERATSCRRVDQIDIASD
jgi:hypothetical protein